MKIDYRKIAEALDISKAHYDRYIAKERAEGVSRAHEWFDFFAGVMAEEADSDEALLNCAEYQEAFIAIMTGNDDDGPALLEDKSEFFAKAFRDEVRRIVAEIDRMEAV
jgi:hypothetical protein